jgi:hypothetical protein
MLAGISLAHGAERRAARHSHHHHHPHPHHRHHVRH